MSKKVFGIDFTAIEKFRESVPIKLPSGETCNLPLVRVRDAYRADLLIHQMYLLNSKSQVILSAQQEFAERSSAPTAETKHETMFASAVAISDRSINYIEELKAVEADTQKVADEIIAFITPYIDNIMCGDKKFADVLRDYPTMTVCEVLQCMLYGVDALEKEDSENLGTKEDSPNPIPGESLSDWMSGA